ncbi:hypothetical protein HA402_002249 [Bradysia odoriphaga]|nr:hypothetical protein HA402_002249 [Bradysia odoriphaga]
MNVVNFLKANSVDQLKSQFSIKVKQYPEEGLIVLNYTVFSAENDPIVKECRSLILTIPDYKIVSRSFDRFLNYNEVGPGDPIDVDGGEYYAKEKIDGSLIKFYQFDGTWCVSTRGMAFAEGEINRTTATITPITYKQAVYEALNISHDDEFQKFCQTYNLNESYTYILELTGKDNRVIIEYNPNKYELWLLGIRRNDATGEYMDIEKSDLPNELIKKPKVYSFPSMVDCVNQAKQLTDLQEGFVICNKSTGQPVYKVKSSRYVCYHNAITNGDLTARDILKLIVNEDWKEFIAYFPEHGDAINEQLELVRRYFSTVETEFEELRKTMKFDYDFSVFDGKQWKSIAITAIKKKEANFVEIFMKSYDTNKKLAFLLKALNVN